MARLLDLNEQPLLMAMTKAAAASALGISNRPTNVLFAECIPDVLELTTDLLD